MFPSLCFIHEGWEWVPLSFSVSGLPRDGRGGGGSFGGGGWARASVIFIFSSSSYISPFPAVGPPFTRV